MTTNKELLGELKKIEETIDNINKKENKIRNMLLLTTGGILCMLFVVFLV